MTDLNKPVKRICQNSFVRDRGLRQVVVILRPPNIIGFRAKGCRKEYQLTIDRLYVLAVDCEIAARKKQRAKERKEGKNANRKQNGN